MLLIRKVNQVRLVGLVTLSAIFLMLSFPNFDVSFLAWFAFIPLFFAIRNTKPSQAFLLGYLTGLIFYLGSIYWLIHVTLLGWVLLCLYLALYFGVFALFLRHIPRLRSGQAIYDIRYTILTVPAAWVAFEYLRTNFATGFGWSLLGYSQYKNLPIIQIADITGAYGVSFLIVMVNVAIYHLLLAIKNKASKKTTLYSVLCTLYSIIVLSLALTYGYFKLAQEPTGETLKVSVIQGNISQEQKWDEAYETFIFERYAILTRVASADEPDLIIWPETAFPGYFGEDKKLTRRVKKLVREIKTPILFGTPLVRTTHNAQRTTNSAMLLDSRGEPTQIYDKLHLVPFGEYVPFEQWLGFVHDLAPYPIAGFAPGDEYTVFKLPNAQRTTLLRQGFGGQAHNAQHNFSVLICFEDIFPRLSRQFVKKGASFLVNITNDAWFKQSSAPYQHAQASVFRAVENRVNMIRSANTGLSCFIDFKGRILSRVENGRGKDIFVEGYDTQTIRIESATPFYTRYGDIFAYMCIVIFFITLLVLPRRFIS